MLCDEVHIHYHTWMLCDEVHVYYHICKLLSDLLIHEKWKYKNTSSI